MSGRSIDDQFLDNLRNKVNIVDVISRYIPLTKRGSSIVACCPFHMEKTPSFHINLEEQYYHCFGCGVGGNVFTFIQKYENVDFVRAVEIVAKIAGVEMPETSFNKDIVERKKRREKSFEINKLAAKHYNENLFSNEGSEAYNYLINRGLSRRTIIKFGLGYSKDYNDIINYLKNKGYSNSDLLDAGICQNDGKRVFDTYGSRITFPIINTYDQVVGFSARTMKKSDNIAKYKNTPANLIFDKSSLLFSLNNVKKLKQVESIKEILVLEGQMDVIKLYEAGIKNCVACLGTALTQQHAKLLKRFSEKIILSLDGDAAGQKAAFKSIDVLENENINVRVVIIPNNLDPDEYVSKYGKDEFLKLFLNAKTGTQFKLECLSNNFNLNDKFEKSKYIKQSLEILSKLNDIDKELYLESLSKIANMPLDILRRNLISDINNSSKIKEQIVGEQTLINNAYVTARKFVLAALLNKKVYAYNPLDENFDLIDSDLIKLFEYITAGKKVGDIYSYFNEEDCPQVYDVLKYNFDFASQESEEKFYEDSVKLIKLNVLNKRKDEVNKKIITCLDNNERKELIEEMGNIIKQINKYKTEEN